MSDSFEHSHKAKHLWSHVLVAAGSRRWPGATRGQSGETARGFYADFGLAGMPGEVELAALADDMARVVLDFQDFRSLQLSPREAKDRFGGQRWKQYQVEVIAEASSAILCSDLDGFVDICDCALKEPRELRALHPEKFQLVQAHPVVWSHRGRDEFLIRITGELFPRPQPCECCSP